MPASPARRRKRWLGIMKAYEKGDHAYHATMPTDALRLPRDTMAETKRFGFAKARAARRELDDKVRALVAAYEMPSVATPEVEAPGVVASCTDHADVHAGRTFITHGMQAAAGVPMQCDRPVVPRFRIGLFGLDMLANVGRTVHKLERALAAIAAPALAAR